MPPMSLTYRFKGIMKPSYNTDEESLVLAGCAFVIVLHQQTCHNLVEYITPEVCLLDILTNFWRSQ